MLAAKWTTTTARRAALTCAPGAHALAAISLVASVLAACGGQREALGASATASTTAPVTHAAAPSTEDTRPHERYSHEDVLALLRQDDSVIPATPPVHPVHTVYNREAVIPPMCYTRHEGTHNPCFVCHQDARKERPNRMDDGGLQKAYSFSEVGTKNQWKNLFEDRSERVAAISDAAIKAWVAQDNYSELAGRLREVKFGGYIPDLKNLQLGAAAFDEEGFAKDGSHWVAFKYKPMPSTFWPTNGSTDDVMIRLSEPFRTKPDGTYSRDVYRANLALVEANIKGFSEIGVAPVDEREVGVDLDGDGRLATATRITRTGEFVGSGARYVMLPHIYPEDTEFLHSVRYLGVADDGSIHIPARMKELRYMRKRWVFTHDQLFEAYQKEAHAKEVGELPGYVNRGQYGLDNEMGWVIAGFIENRSGRLRVNNYEETLFCMGCHTSIGSTIDSTFSFARKVDGAAGWGYIDLRGMPDAPTMGETRGEIATYLERAGGGGEFRSNPEMAQRFLRDGKVDAARIAEAQDVYALLAPSASRALTLNKAYRVIVDDQDFIYGRDATVTPPPNVYERVGDDAPTLPASRTYAWDLRLDWSARPEAKKHHP